MESLTGIRWKIDMQEAPLECKIIKSKFPGLDSYAGMAAGGGAPVGPQLSINDAEAICKGVYADGKVALAEKKLRGRFAQMCCKP